MSRRFSNIRNGALLNEALTKYKQWEDNRLTRHNQNVGTRGDRPAQTALAIVPFGVSLGTGNKFPTSAAQTGYSALSSALTGYTDELTQATNTQDLVGFRPARIIAFFRTGSGIATTSDITGLKYLKYNGNRHSAPFGKKGTDLEFKCFSDIKSAIVSGGTKRSVSYTPERIKQS